MISRGMTRTQTDNFSSCMVYKVLPTYDYDEGDYYYEVDALNHCRRPGLPGV